MPTLAPHQLLLRPVRYFGLIRIGILIWLAYRMSSFMKLIDFPIVIGVYACLFRALYQSLPAGASIGGLDLAATLTYIALVWLIESFINTRLDNDIGWEVREGTIAVFLARPIDLQAFYFFQTLGHISYRLLLITGPILLLVTTVLDLVLPPTPGQAGAFLLAIFGAFLLMFQINFLLGILAFFLEWNYGIYLLKESVLRGLGGLLIPLSVMPDAVRLVLLKLPFAYLYYVPVQIWLGSLTGPALWEALAWQWGWVLAMQVFCRGMLALALRRVTIAGG